ncbi:ArsR/SmtB family transcription factor [Rhizobium rhizophilum]|uniref:Uncharacterized protein n=1 Tax=Rhizobium rhizophilum TaxID=1850373 RepID=A0ABY2QS92_9HYPH|nr:hypothetical protein [Rhizobium rhizophilum]THV12515.1 hypothetical protein E9677_17305 [Rhizobium rhizophilum]
MSFQSMTHLADHLHERPKRNPTINPSFTTSARATLAFSKKMEVDCEFFARIMMPLHSRAEEKIALEKAAVVFSSLSNIVRLGVLLRLIKREWSVNELAADPEISQSARSQLWESFVRQALSVHEGMRRPCFIAAIILPLFVCWPKLGSHNSW